MTEEMNIEVDEEDNVLGLRPRGDFHGGKRIHRASHLILLTYQDRIMLQKRAQTKKWYPGLWDYAVGETVKNESYSECITRGAKEELGLDGSTFLYEFFKYFTSDEGIDKAWRMVFLGITTKKEFSFDKKEIEELEWFSPKELKKDIEQNPQKFTPHLVRGLGKYFLF